jgi:hypothetical protein
MVDNLSYGIEDYIMEPELGQAPRFSHDREHASVDANL